MEGWDFSFERGRTEGKPLPWDYQEIARGLVAKAHRVLDVDTGGGEMFSSLGPPAGSIAVEPHHPNVAVAAQRLEPLGIGVVERRDTALPVSDGGFDLVLNRHGYLQAEETSRALMPGGRLLTQQVGARNDVEFNEALDTPASIDPAAAVGPQRLVDSLNSAGLRVIDVREAVIVTRYLDVGAVVFHLRAVPWQVPGFDVVRHRRQLEEIHRQITRDGAFVVRSQRFLVHAQK